MLSNTNIIIKYFDLLIVTLPLIVAGKPTYRDLNLPSLQIPTKIKKATWQVLPP